MDQHKPHALFVEMDELMGEEWVEQARWIKYEEAREAGSERWGKPHVSSLSFHSLLNLRFHLDQGNTAILMDFEGKDMTTILFSIVEEFHHCGLLEQDQKAEVWKVLRYKHRFMQAEKKLHHGPNFHSFGSSKVSQEYDLQDNCGH